MSYAELNRTGLQALWNHLPDQPFNWEAKASVMGLTPRQVTPLDIPEQWVAPQLRRLIRPFAEGVSGIPNSGPELDIIDRGQFRLVEAEDLRAERFPNTFLCNRCGYFTALRAITSAGDCPNGHGPLRQFSFVQIHTCGLIRELTPGRCPNNHRAPMALINWRSLKTGDWYWRCTRCGARDNSSVIRWCDGCRNGRISIVRVPQTSAYYPQQITVLNPPTRTSYGTLTGARVRDAAIAQVIGALPSGLTTLQRAAGGGGQSPEEQVKATAEALGLSPGDPLYEQLIEAARAKGGAEPTWQAAVDALGLTPEQAELVGDESLQLSLTSGAAPLGIDELIATAPSPALRAQYEHVYKPLLDRYHFQDVTLLRELPIAFIVAGYTRLSSKATRATRGGSQSVHFNYFPDPKNGKYPMYGMRSETEGLLFRVDQLEVVRWLVASGIVADPGVTTSDEAQTWLLTVMDPVVDIFGEPDNRISRAVLGLVHSMAHRMMKALAARCGLNVDSLAEYLFPGACAFLVYANTRSQFTLGGIEHVFRYDLADALEELDAEMRCMFDPPCRRSFGGACVACLHVSEVACQRFNTVLDRNLLFGSLPQATLPTGTAGSGGETSSGDVSPATGSEAGDVVEWTAFWKR